MKKDVVIIGAGTGGLAAGLALAGKGLDVTILESQAESSFGNPWVNETDVGSFEKFGMPRPLPTELAFGMRRMARLKTADDTAQIPISGMVNYSLKMWEYQRRLARLCAARGVDVRFETRAGDFLVSKNFVRGVAVQQGASTAVRELEAKIVILACGSQAPILKKLPAFCEDCGVETSPKDQVRAIQELYAINVDLAREKVRQGGVHDNEVIMYCGLPQAGGFSTLLYQMDLAQGLFGIMAASRTPSQNVKPARMLIDDFLKQMGFCTQKLHGGGRAIAMRPATDSLVDNGLILAGDAAHAGCPANGSGTSPSLITGVLSARVAARVLLAGARPSKEALWEISHRHQCGLGAVFAGHYVSQRVLRSFSENQVQDLVRRVMRPHDFLSVHEMLPAKVSVQDGLSRVISGWPVFGLLLRMVRGGPHIQAAMRHYAVYPRQYDQTSLAAWKKKKERIFAKLQE